MSYINTSFDSVGTQFAWDATSLDLWFTCPRKYYLTMIENWRPKEESVHLLFGAAYASSLELFHKLRAAGRDYNEAMIDVVQNALVLTWDSKKGEPVEFLHNAKTRPNLIRTIVWYLEQFREDPLPTYITREGKAAVELSFTIPVGDFVLTGHIDRLVTYAEDILVTDNKTTGSTITSKYMRQFDMSLQMSQYTFAGKALFSVPVAGVVIDAAQIAVGFSRFERGYTFRHEEQLTEWLDTVTDEIVRAREMTARKQFPMNPTACDKYGGCKFFAVCAAPKRVRHLMLEGNYTQQGEPWDPMKRR